MINFIKIFAIVFFTLFFNGCDDSNYMHDSNNPDITQTGKINGIIVDGYISNSNLWLDLNSNGSKDSYEPTSTSNSNGSFTFNDPVVIDGSFISFYATGGVDTSTDRYFTEVFQTILDTSTLDSDKTYVISPLTDLVAIWFEYNIGNDSSDLVDAKYKIANIFETSSLKVDQDPMKDKDLFAMSQYLQHTKLLLKYILMNNMGDLSDEQEKTLEKNIKIELIKRGLNLEDVLLDFELMHSCSEPNSNDPFCLVGGLPENQKEFVIKQAKELKDALEELTSGISLDIENLNRLQKLLDIEMNKAYALLINSDSTTILEIIDIDITIESITRTIFSTVDAENDENSCKNNNTYNELLNSKNPWPEIETQISTDLENGISLKALGTEAGIEKYEVIIYYPDLQSEPTGQKSTRIEYNRYSFGYDTAWLENDNNTIYVRTAKDTDGLYSCYRYQLSSTNTNEVTATKVFRYTQL